MVNRGVNPERVARFREVSNMAVKYGEFEFPSDKGFTGSSGKTLVKAHYRQGGPVSDKDRAFATAAQQARMTRNAQRTPEDSVRAIKATPIGKGAGAISDQDRAKLARNAKLGLAGGGAVRGTGPEKSSANSLARGYKSGGCVGKKNPHNVGSREPVVKKGLGGIVKKIAGSGLFGLAGLAASGALGGKDEDKPLAQQMNEAQRNKMTGNA